jgi:integrase
VSIHKKRTKQGETRWVVRWRTPGGEPREKWCERADDAEAFEHSVMHSRNEGRYIDPQAGRELFATYATRLISDRVDVRPRTLENVEGRLRNHVLPYFGDWPIASIGADDVRHWLAGLVRDSGLAPDTVKAIFLTAGQVFTAAEHDRVIARSPLVGIHPPRAKGRTEMTFLDELQVEQLAAAIAPRFSALIMSAAYTGLRAGELAALRVERLNWLRSRLHVVESVSEPKGHGVVFGPTKTYETRWVPMPPFVAELLETHAEQYSTTDGLVFSSPEGGPLRHRNFMRRHFKPAVVRAGLPERLRFHDLRHTAAALMIDEGASLEQVKKILGHSSIRVTSDTYGHLFQGHADELMKGLGERRARARAGLARGSEVADLGDRAAKATRTHR